MNSIQQWLKDFFYAKVISKIFGWFYLSERRLLSERFIIRYAHNLYMPVILSKYSLDEGVLRKLLVSGVLHQCPKWLWKSSDLFLVATYEGYKYFNKNWYYINRRQKFSSSFIADYREYIDYGCLIDKNSALYWDVDKKPYFLCFKFPKSHKLVRMNNYCYFLIKEQNISSMLLNVPNSIYFSKIL